MTVRVIYHQGSFVPQDQCEFQEGTEGMVLVTSSRDDMSLIVGPDERKSLLAGLVAEMKANPLPAGSPRLTRDQMHERD